MVGTWLVLGFFILAGLAVVGAAMAGTRRRGQQLTPAQARSRTRAVVMAVGAVVVLTGIVVPAVVMVTNAENAPARGPSGIELTAAEASGRQLFVARCGQCHILDAANTVGRVGPNLDVLRPPAALTLDAIKQGRARGLGQMPAGLYDGEEARRVAAYVARVAGR